MNSLSCSILSLRSDEFSSLVCHELSYPLTLLENAIQSLSSGQFGELSFEGNQLIAQALANLDRLTRLANTVKAHQDAGSLLSQEQMRLLQLKQDLPKAIDQGEFYLVYQPIFAPTAQTILGLEALARWHHPRYGLISPTVFIPLAEETQLIHVLGQQLIQQACHQLRQWQDQFPQFPRLQISVNVSALQLLQPDFPRSVAAALQANSLHPDSLKLEITESALLENNAAVSLVLKQLTRLGVKLQMDDFGTGYSTLSRLQILPVDTLKIDRSFVVNRNWEICEVILALAQKLKFKVIVEGVETQAEVLKLQAIGIQAMQGYYFSPPLAIEAASALLARFQLSSHSNVRELSALSLVC